MADLAPEAEPSTLLDTAIRFNSIHEMFVFYASKISAHGWNSLVVSRGHCRSFYWMTLVCSACVLLITLCSETVYEYFTYPVSTNVKDQQSVDLHFPAITICNMNAIASDETGEGKKNGYLKIKEEIKYIFLNSTNIYQNQLRFNRLLGRTAVESPLNFGHKLNNMLVYCTFLGKFCNHSHFFKTYSTTYGNCYTFNAYGDKKTATYGVQEGLFLVMDVQRKEHSPFFKISTGFRLSVHSHLQYPFPEDDGFNVAPGYTTFAGILKTSKHHIPKPYSKCEHLSGEHMKLRDAYNGLLPATKYGELSCMKTCQQVQLFQYCSCFDPKLVMYSNKSKAFDQLREEKGFSIFTDPKNLLCKEKNKKHQQCLNYFDNIFKKRKRLGEDGILIDTLCPLCIPVCSMEKYTVSLSSGHYRSQEHFGSSKNKHFKKLFNQLNDWQRSAYVKENFVAIDIYYKRLQEEIYSDSKKITIPGFIGGLGGHMGLWMGFSVITFMEFLEVVYDLFYNYLFWNVLLGKRKSEYGESDRRKIRRRNTMREILNTAEDEDLDMIFLQHIWKKSGLPFDYKQLFMKRFSENENNAIKPLL